MTPSRCLPRLRLRRSPAVFLAATWLSLAPPAFAGPEAATGALRAGTTAPRPATAAAPARLPATELLVDWRLVPAADPPAPDGGATGTGTGGGLVVGTASPVPPGWSATRSRDAAPPAEVATVRVMNGHEAAWQVDRSQIRRDHDLVWTVQGQGVASRDTVVHDARSLVATPRWPGGSAPVEVALDVRASRPGTGDEPATDPSADPALPASRDAALRTTVSLPFDAWVTVARVGAEDVQVRVRRH